MPDVWLPGAYRDPGRNAGYNAGWSHMMRAVAHFTVGRDSRNVGRDGYFHILVHRDASRENGCTQYAEINAITWHAANQGNPYGPGYEFERMTTDGYNDEGLANAEELTNNQIEWGKRIVDWSAEWGLPAKLWNGERYGAPVMPGGNWNGWVNHHDLDANRGDGFTNAEWNMISTGQQPGPSPEPEPERGKRMWMAHIEDIQWIDLWVEGGVIVDGWTNDIFTGGKTDNYLGQGIPITTYKRSSDYEDIRDRMMAPFYLAKMELDERLSDRGG